MFIRSKTHPFGRKLPSAMVRTLLIALYVFYPLGCILQLVPEAAGGGALLSTAGLIVLLASIIVFLVLAGSSLQRQTQEPAALLDERELGDRNRATYLAHSLFSSVVLIGILYMLVATDVAANGKFSLWRPTMGDHWSAIFWGLMMLSLTLPGAILAFGKAPPELD